MPSRRRGRLACVAGKRIRCPRTRTSSGSCEPAMAHSGERYTARRARLRRDDIDAVAADAAGPDASSTATHHAPVAQSSSPENCSRSSAHWPSSELAEPLDGFAVGHPRGRPHNALAPHRPLLAAVDSCLWASSSGRVSHHHHVAGNSLVDQTCSRGPRRRGMTTVADDAARTTPTTLMSTPSGMSAPMTSSADSSRREGDFCYRARRHPTAPTPAPTATSGGTAPDVARAIRRSDVALCPRCARRRTGHPRARPAPGCCATCLRARASA